jgi:hypothetical protein
MPKYRGVLSEPLNPEDGPEAYWERIEALADYYDIDLREDAAWLRLALELAAAHVPGFKMKAANLPREGIVAQDVTLLRDMLKLTKVHSTKRAAELVVNARPDLGYTDAESLQLWFEDFMNPANSRYDKRRAMAFALLRYKA